MAHIHLIGIGGSGLSAIARVLLESGSSVSGSDRQLSPQALGLQPLGARLYAGHRPENVHGADTVVRSSAIPDDNVEVQEALRLGIPVLKRAEFLGRWLDEQPGRQVVAIAGTHGKTTTTAMIAWVLSALNRDPSYIIGGVSANLDGNAHAGGGPQFVIEADEYDRMFLGLRPNLAVVTNVEHDHPDCYPTAQDFELAFWQFTQRLQTGGALIACGDDSGAANLLAKVQEDGMHAFAYGIEDSAYDYRAIHITRAEQGAFEFEAAPNGQAAVKIRLQVPGRHNILNALAAFAAADQLGLPLGEAAQALGDFRGTGRRFEVRVVAGGVALVDDYAHHPTEIRATLAAARARYPGRTIWAVWQPHTYSRTRTLLTGFLNAFQEADHVLVTEIYAAREAPPADEFSARQVVAQMHHPDAVFVGSLQAAGDTLEERLQAGDVVLVLSAGDADQINVRLAATLEQRKVMADAGRADKGRP
jgi:UDP-N-acetylmuramate--alanine ligase